MTNFFRIGVLSFMLLHAAHGENLFVYFGTHTAGPGKGFSLAHFDTTTGALSKTEFLLEAPAPAHRIRLRIAVGGIEIKGSPAEAQPPAGAVLQ